MNTLFVNVWFQKLKYLYPLHGRLFDLHPPPPGFLFQGVFDGPPPPRNFERFFSRAQEFSVTTKGRHIFDQGIAYHPLEIQSGFGT